MHCTVELCCTNGRRGEIWNSLSSLVLAGELAVGKLFIVPLVCLVAGATRTYMRMIYHTCMLYVALRSSAG